jgi:hypothetical protein
LPKIAQNHPNWQKNDKTHVKGTKNGAKDVCEGIFTPQAKNQFKM